MRLYMLTLVRVQLQYDEFEIVFFLMRFFSTFSALPLFVFVRVFLALSSPCSYFHYIICIFFVLIFLRSSLLVCSVSDQSLAS